MTTVITADDVAEKLEGRIAGKLDELVNARVKTALQQYEERGTREGFVTPDGGGQDTGIKNFGDWLVAVKRRDEKRLSVVYKSTKAMNEQDGTEGGYTVPPQFNTQLLQVAGDVNPVDALTGARAPMALPMTGRTLTVPALDQTAAPSTGNSAMSAGVVGKWTAEGGTIQETQPAFSPVELNAHKYAGYTKASNELEADSAVALASLLIRLFGQAVGYARLYSFLRGNGVGKPLGVYNAPAAKSVTRGTGADNYETADLLGMASGLTPGSRGRAVWMMHPYAEQYLATLTFGSSQALVYPSQEGYPMRMLGAPAYPVEFMSAPGTAFDLALIDWSYYLVGTKGETAIASSEHVNFLSDEMTWRFTHRVDGQPWLKNKITLSDGAGSNTVSPFVYLS